VPFVPVKIDAVAIDPLVALASTLDAGPGTTAILLGAGVSRAAQIPTGWDVVVDLIRRVAAAGGEDPADPVGWWAERQGDNADYSELLGSLGAAPADRRSLLAGYFVPTDEERAEGVKVPTAAHRAIAELVRSGHITVIMTTNFDRPVELALANAGVDPVVISSPSAAEGAIPLAHARCTVIKLHGDYLDPDLKNTAAELGAYHPTIDGLLDRVLDEYGLIVCRWSATWDEALRTAMLRAKGHRYSTYWAHLGPLGERAEVVATHRQAVRIPIASADEFFTSLACKVAALAEMRDRRPRSTAIAVTELKRCLPDPVRRIRLHDLIMDETTRALSDRVNLSEPQPAAENVLARYRTVETASATLLALLVTMAYFADRHEHDELLVEVLRRLAAGPVTEPRQTTFNVWENALYYPALLAVYAVGLGCIARDRMAPFAQALARIKVHHPTGTDEKLSSAAASWRALNPEVVKTLYESKRKTPVSDYLHEVLREPAHWVIPVDADYDRLFDELEYALGVICTADYGRGPIGRFVWRDQYGIAGRWPVGAIDRNRADLLDAGLFEGLDAKLQEATSAYKENIKSSGLGW